MRPHGRYTQSTAEKVCEEKRERGEGKGRTEEMAQGRTRARKKHGVMGKIGDKFNVHHDKLDEKDHRNEKLSKHEERD